MCHRFLIYAVLYSFFLATLGYGEVRKVTQPDVEWGPYTEIVTSSGGHMGGKLPRYYDNNAFADNLALFGKSLTGDGSGSITGFNIPLYISQYLSVYDALTAWEDVRKYGAIGDNTTDSAPSFQNAIDTAHTAGGGTVFIPRGVFRINSQLTLSDDVILLGQGRMATFISKGFNGDMINMGERTEIRDLTLEGQGATYTGKGLVITGTNGRQSVSGTRIVNTYSYALEFEILAGSQSVWHDMEMYTYYGLDNTLDNNYAVFIPNTLNGAGTPRSFSSIVTSGGKFIDLGGCNGLFISNSYVGHVKFRSESRGVHIVGSRLGGTTVQMDVIGYNIAMSGNNFGSYITVLDGTLSATIVGNTYNFRIINNSPSPTNNIEMMEPLQYTPTITSTNVNASVGDATNRGYYLRNGNMVTVEIDFTFGSTTSFGTGTINFSIPSEVAPISGWQQQHFGSGVAQSYVGQTKLFAMTARYNDNVIGFIFDNTTSGITSTYPFTWSTGDIIRGTVTYVR